MAGCDESRAQIANMDGRAANGIGSGYEVHDSQGKRLLKTVGHVARFTALSVDRLLQGIQNLPGMAGRLGFGPGHPHHALRVDQDRRTSDPGGFFAVHLLGTPGSVVLKDPMIGITQEFDANIVFGDELPVGADRIRA